MATRKESGGAKAVPAVKKASVKPAVEPAAARKSGVSPSAAVAGKPRAKATRKAEPVEEVESRVDDEPEVAAELLTGSAADDDESSDVEAELDAEIEVDRGDADGDLDLEDIPELAPKKRNLPATASAGLPESLSALNIYLARLKSVEILPIEEQAQLAAEYQRSGDKESAARLVASNLRLVVKIAFQFRRQWADVMDLIAEGNLGLAEAIRKFDATRGIPFPSYARFWIRARILAFIQENKHLIHAGSRAARKLFWRLERERRQLISEGSEPTPLLLAERVGVREEDIRELAPILDQRPVSMDTPVHGDEDGRTRGETMWDPNAGDPESDVGGGEIQGTLRKVFAEYRETLDVRERAIWDLRLQSEEPVRLEDLGDQFGVSKERVRQLEVRIKSRLKDFVQKRLGNDVIVEALH